jgi:hypothetical protein
MPTLFNRLTTALRSGIAALDEDRRAALHRHAANGSDWARDRAGAPDLYYTAFARMIRHALDLTPHNRKLANLPCAPAEMDLVHLGSWIRIRHIGPAWISPADPATDRPSLERFRRPDGGYALTPDGESSVTAAYLALNAGQDLGLHPPAPESLEQFVSTQRTGDGFANSTAWPRAILPATAAAVHLLDALTGQTPAPALNWISRCALASGGFGLFPQAPIPDPLATGIALFTLKTFDYPIEQTEAHHAYLLALWRDSGGFVGHPSDPDIDAEYTFYGLLGLAG